MKLTVITNNSIVLFSHTEQQQCPPLPPKTYKNKQRLASVSIHEMADILQNSMNSTSSGGRRVRTMQLHHIIVFML